MQTKLTGCWSNKLLSLVTLKESISKLQKNCSLVEAQSPLSSNTRNTLLSSNRELLIDSYLLLECILADDQDLIHQRSVELNANQQA